MCEQKFSSPIWTCAELHCEQLCVGRKQHCSILLYKVVLIACDLMGRFVQLQPCQRRTCALHMRTLQACTQRHLSTQHHLSRTTIQIACTCRALHFRTSARHVLVIEKEAVFRSLCDAAVWAQLPVILITACGMPDLATRAFLRHLADSLPRQLAVMGLVDWNPAGVHILMNYKLGAAKRSAESVECAP